MSICKGIAVIQDKRWKVAQTERGGCGRWATGRDEEEGIRKSLEWAIGRDEGAGIRKSSEWGVITSNYL